MDASKRLIFFENLGLDIVSSLQDDILHHILSFVSIEDVVRTSILSKRWLNLRNSSPIVILVDRPTSSTRIGLEVVNQVLTRHGPSDIRSFTLMISSPVDLSHLRIWIHTAKTHNVQNLELILDVDNLFELPKGLYNCQSLVGLKLSMTSILKAPKCTQFSGLKSLHLSKIIFHKSFHRILTNSPTLEELALVNCEWDNVVSRRVTMPMLRSLTIEQNLVEGGILSCIRFSAPNLSSFHCSSNLFVYFRLHENYSLESAILDIAVIPLYVVLSPRAVKLVKDVQYVKHLSISNQLIICFMAVRGYQQILQPFENLTYLEIHSKYSVLLTDLFLDFLNKVPHLEFLDLSQGIGENPLFTRDYTEMMVPDCFHSSLKKICITNFEGRTEEMALLKFLLQNATVLEGLLIYFSNELLMNPEKVIEVSHHIEVLPRVSDSLLIYYSDPLPMDM